LDHGSLEFSEDAHHLKHLLPRRCGRVESLLVKVEIDFQSMDFGQADQILQRSAESIDRPGYNHIELSHQTADAGPSLWNNRPKILQSHQGV
jgi:hypothetical protein